MLHYFAVLIAIAGPSDHQRVAPLMCVGWRQTGGCVASGTRQPSEDRPCEDVIPPTSSGWCECAEEERDRGGRLQRAMTSQVDCGHATFTCGDRCRLLSLNRAEARLARFRRDREEEEERKRQPPTRIRPVIMAAAQVLGQDASDLNLWSCTGWLQTAGCRSSGAREQHKDMSANRGGCALKIAPKSSGACECVRPLFAGKSVVLRAKMDCGHATLTCGGVCRVVSDHERRASERNHDGTLQEKDVMGAAVVHLPISQTASIALPLPPASVLPAGVALHAEVRGGDVDKIAVAELEAEAAEARLVGGAAAAQHRDPPHHSRPPAFDTPLTFAAPPTTRADAALRRRLALNVALRRIGEHDSDAPRFRDWTTLDSFDLNDGAASLRRLRARRRGQRRRTWPILPADAVRRAQVVEAIRTTWVAYESAAFGRDELVPAGSTAHVKGGIDAAGISVPPGNSKPVGRVHDVVGPAGLDTWGGFGLTLVDSMDLLYLAGLRGEFDRAVKWCEQTLDVDKAHNVSTFETTIRLLGGLLSGWLVSNRSHPILLDKAIRIAQTMRGAFAERGQRTVEYVASAPMMRSGKSKEVGGNNNASSTARCQSSTKASENNGEIEDGRAQHLSDAQYDEEGHGWRKMLEMSDAELELDDEFALLDARDGRVGDAVVDRGEQQPACVDSASTSAGLSEACAVEWDEETFMVDSSRLSASWAAPVAPDVNLQTGRAMFLGTEFNLAEVGTLSLEFLTVNRLAHLSHHTPFYSLPPRRIDDTHVGVRHRGEILSSEDEDAIHGAQFVERLNCSLALGLRGVRRWVKAIDAQLREQRRVDRAAGSDVLHPGLFPTTYTVQSFASRGATTRIKVGGKSLMCVYVYVCSHFPLFPLLYTHTAATLRPFSSPFPPPAEPHSSDTRWAR